MSIPSTGDHLATYRLPDFDLVATPIRGHGVTYQPTKSGAGTGSVSVTLDDPAFDIIDVNDIIAIRPNGTTEAALLVEEIHHHTLDIGGGAKQVATYVGRLAGGVLEWAVIAPSLGELAKPIEEDAIFDWRSRRYDPVAYSDPWNDSTEIMTVTAAKAGGWPTQPMGDKFTDSSGAYMIWDSSGDDDSATEGTCLFLYDVDVTTAGRHGLEVLMDNDGYVWVDTVQVLDINQNEGYHRASFKRVYLSEGTHRLAFQVRNFDGPAALAFNLYKADHQDEPMDGVPFVAISDSATQVLSYPDPFPGMTVGDILTQLVEEAQDGTIDAERDCFPWLDPSFTFDDDSNSDPWDRISVTTKTSTNYLSFLDELKAAGHISRWRLRPDGVTFDVFGPDYTRRPTFAGYPTGYELTPAPVNDPRTGQVVELDRKIT